MNLRQVLRAAIVAFLASPFLFLIAQFVHVNHIDAAEILWAAKNTFIQAFLSATCSVLLGLWGAAGLLCFSSSVRRRWRALLEMLLLLPNFLPSLFVLLSVLNLIDPFPIGITGIILVHTAINWGLMAVLLASLIENKAGGVAELAWIEGSGRIRFLIKGLGPMLIKDLGLLWVFVFSVCFGSFAIPLVVGGGRGTTLEVLIYERIRLSTDWSQAVMISAIQSAFLFAIAWMAARGRSVSVSRPSRMQLFHSYSGVIGIVVFSFLLALGYLQGLPSGFSQIRHFMDVEGEMFRAVLGSLTMGIVTGLFCLSLLLGIAMLTPSRWFEKFLSSFTAPSQALAAFAVLVLSPNEGLWPYFKIPATLSILLIPVLWRMGWQSDLDGLKRQREVAQTLGAGEQDFVKSILIPQLAGRATTLAGLAAAWAVGDFAVSRILAHQDLTLGMITQTLMTGYRLGLATVLSLAVLAISAFCFLFMKGVGRVLSRKSLS